MMTKLSVYFLSFIGRDVIRVCPTNFMLLLNQAESAFTQWCSTSLLQHSLLRSPTSNYADNPKIDAF